MFFDKLCQIKLYANRWRHIAAHQLDFEGFENSSERFVAASTGHLLFHEIVTCHQRILPQGYLCVAAELEFLVLIVLSISLDDFS